MRTGSLTPAMGQATRRRHGPATRIEAASPSMTPRQTGSPGRQSERRVRSGRGGRQRRGTSPASSLAVASTSTSTASRPMIATRCRSASAERARHAAGDACGCARRGCGRCAVADGDEPIGDQAARRLRGAKPAGKLLRDEAGRQAPVAPARMLHQGSTGRGCCGGCPRSRNRRAHPPWHRSRCEPVRRMRAQLGDHRVIVDRDLAALEDAGVVADDQHPCRGVPPADGR